MAAIMMEADVETLIQNLVQNTKCKADVSALADAVSCVRCSSSDPKMQNLAGRVWDALIQAGKCEAAGHFLEVC